MITVLTARNIKLTALIMMATSCITVMDKMDGKDQLIIKLTDQLIACRHRKTEKLRLAIREADYFERIVEPLIKEAEDAIKK